MNVLVALPLDEAQKSKLTGAVPQYAYTFRHPNGVSAEDAAQADIIIGNINSDLLPHCKRLKWYQLRTDGVDRVLLSGKFPSGVLLTNAGGAYDIAQSEFMLSILLAVMKKLPRYADNHRERLWHDEGNERMVFGSRIVLVGMGRIGGTLSSLLRGLGAYTVGVTKSGKSDKVRSDELYDMSHLEEQLSLADAVILTLPATRETFGMFDEGRFAAIKRGAILVNAGRGSCIVTDALVNALRDGTLSGAALDVVEPEPLPPDHPLWGMANVFITPHVAGHDFLPQVLNYMVDISASNLKRYALGLELKNLIDVQRGY